MNSKDLIGKICVVADHSHTDNGKLQKVITRYQHATGDDEHDIARMSTYAELHKEDMLNQSHAKRRHAHKRIFIYKIMEVIDVVDDK